MTASTPTLPATRMQALRGSTTFWIAVVNVIAIATFAFASPNFLQPGNIQNILFGGSQILLLAAGMSLLLGAGELDISLGSNVVVSSVVGAKVMVAVAGAPDPAAAHQPDATLAILLGALASVAAGLIFGAVNGFLVARLGLSSFIATLGMLGVGAGFALVISNGTNVVNIPPAVQENFGLLTFYGLPVPAILVAVIVVLLWFFLTKTRFGVRVLAIGSSRQAADRVGIRSRRYVFGLFVLLGGLAGLAGFVDVSRFATTNLSGHTDTALAAIAGAVIGGASLWGGRASIPGAVLGALLAVVLQNGLVIVGLPVFYQQIAVGAVLIVAVYIDIRSSKRSTS
ncbi:ABC transporter permease [Leifsonia sp. C5G2]|uniref:ABC transporter permease n=1 Tax=Leifsonia sp. C5G2 TaxID=2735269 RepID=UPI0015853A76|nr:ABC transporter permease [Leifsonia sp. C5G2]NUU05246.1 ABC transporter permease [Leifsonia sp. C5G2]